MIIAEKDKIDEMYDKNYKLLTPWLQDSVGSIDNEELWRRIEVTYNDEGYPICRYHKENTSFLINSERPIQEAKKWSKTIPIEEAGGIFLYGCGFAYPLFEIFAQKKQHTLVVVFEQDLFLFKAMLYYFDLEPIIKSQKVAFLIGESAYFANAFDQLFYSIHFIGCTYPSVAVTTTAQRNFKAQYLEIHKYIFKQLSLLVFYLGNDHLDNLIGFLNLLSNVKYIAENPYLSCLKDKFKDVPAFIIANGPSLDKNISELKVIDGRGLIISVESAIKPLIKNNIKPDILTVIERTKATYTCHFENNNYSDDIALICLALVDKHVFPAFPGQIVPVFRENESINQWINNSVGDGSAVNAGANVSHLALEIANYLGANPIVFVGQDYAFGNDGATHSKDSVYYEEKGKKTRDIIHSRPVVFVEGNNGTMIPSYQLWVDFRMGLERKITVHSDRIFLNATQGGAKIEGAKCEKLSEIINKYCISDLPYRVNETIRQSKEAINLKERKEKISEFINSIKQYSNSFRDLVQKTIEGKLQCQKMLRLCREKDSFKYRSILEEAYQKNIAVFNIFIKDYLYRCFSQQILFSDYYLINKLGAINSQEKITEVFKIQYNLFCHLNVVCQSVSVHMENAVEQLQEVLNEFDITDKRCKADD